MPKVKHVYYLKKIRERAGLPEITSTGEQLFEDIINERRLELGLEGFRFFDIVRVGWASEDIQELQTGC